MAHTNKTANGMTVEVAESKIKNFYSCLDQAMLKSPPTKQWVKDEVRRTLDILGRRFKNAYIVAPSNMMTPEIPFENIVALFEACHKQ